MTTASNLYTFLELNPKNFSRWCNTNIKNNKFAIENEDYVSFVIKEERYNPKPKTDYKITSEFAKKLSMTGNTEKHEQARNYFIACEQGLKIATNKLQSSVNIDKLSSAIENVNNVLSSINNRLNKLETKQQEQSTQPAIETTYKRPYNPWFAKMQLKYKLLENYFNVTRGQLYKNILMELENLYDIDTQQIQADYCYENNISSCYPLEPYEFLPKYRDMIEQIVNSNIIKFGIATENNPITSTKHMTIFDSLIKEI